MESFVKRGLSDYLVVFELAEIFHILISLSLFLEHPKPDGVGLIKLAVEDDSKMVVGRLERIPIVASYIACLPL